MKSPELDAVKAIIQALSPLEIQIRRQVLDTANLIIESMEKLVNSSNRKPKNPPIEATALASDDEPNKLFSTAEAAEMLGVSRATILNWQKDGYITGIPKGKDNRSGLVFKKAVLAAFARTHKKHSKFPKKTSSKKINKKTARKSAQNDRPIDASEAAKMLKMSKASGANGVARA